MKKLRTISFTGIPEGYEIPQGGGSNLRATDDGNGNIILENIEESSAFSLRRNSEDFPSPDGAYQYLSTDENGALVWAKNPHPCDISNVLALGDNVTDDSDSIQELLDKHDYVYLPSGTYYIKNHPLRMTRERCTFICEGSLIVGAECALEVQASYCNVKIARIDSRFGGTWNDVDKWSYQTSAIKIGSDSVNASYNTIEVDKIERSINGLWLRPNGYGLNVSNNTFRVKSIQAERCIYFNPGDVENVGINNNQFYGGCLRGNYPIYTVKGQLQTNEFNSNSFWNLSVEGCQKPMMLQSFCMNQFVNLRLSDSNNVVIALDSNSYGNAFDVNGVMNIGSINDVCKDSSHTAYLGNFYKAKRIVSNKEEIHSLGREACSICGHFIIPNDMHHSVAGENVDIDMSSNAYAIDGLVCHVVANEADVNIKLAKGYHCYGATNLYIYVSALDSIYHTVRVSQFDESTQSDVDVVPDSIFTEAGLYKLECLPSVGWVATQFNPKHILLQNRCPVVHSGIIES